MSAESLTYDDFKEHTGTLFTMSEGEVAAFELKLEEVSRYPDTYARVGMRAPFSLIFVATSPEVLPQNLYVLRHDTIGEISLFLVPVAKDQRGVSYQAIFN